MFPILRVLQKGGGTAGTYTINTAGLCSTSVPNMGLLRISPHPNSILPTIYEITRTQTQTHTDTDTHTHTNVGETKGVETN